MSAVMQMMLLGASGGVGNDAFTKLLLHMDGTNGQTSQSDVSVGGAHGAMTLNGASAISTTQSKFGGASFVPGTGGMSYASNADWNLGGTGGGNDFTIDGWIYLNATTDCQLVSAGNYAGTGWNWALETNKMRLYNGTGVSVTWSPATGAWIHIALVRSGTTTTMYANGVSLGTEIDKDLNNDGSALTIGGGSGGATLNGYMDEVRISKGIARWTANFTPPTGAYS